MLLDSLRIKNFQAHEDFGIAFDAGVTAIVGPTDSGKSSVIRAIRWLATNEPSGEEFVRWGSSGSQVRLKLSSGVSVVRERGGENIYKLDGKEFRAFGNGVPPEIQSALGLADINFQGQYDSPFWLSSTAGEVARSLNRIVNLEIIDSVLSKLVAGARKSRAEYDSVKERRRQLKDRVEEWQFATDLDKELSELERANEAILEAGSSVNELTDLLGRLKGSRFVNESCAKIARAGDGALESWARHEKLSSSVLRLRAVVDQLRRLASVPRVPPNCLAVLEESESSRRVAAGSYDCLKNMIDDVKGARLAAKRLQDELVPLQADYTERLGDSCPLCGQAIR